MSSAQLSLQQQLASLIDPKPEADPEEPHWDTGEIDYNKDVEQEPISNNARFMEAPTKKRLLPDIVMGPQYRGKKISRKELKDEPAQPEATAGAEEESEEDDQEEEEEDENVMKINLEDSSSDDFEESQESHQDDEISLMKSDQARNREMEADKLEEEVDEEETPKVANVENQRTKAQHLLNQKVLWDSLLDVRISFQGLLDIGNRLPKPGDYGYYAQNEEVRKAMEGAAGAVKGLLKDLGGLQQKFVEKDPFVKIDKETKDMEEYLNWNFIEETQKMIEEASKPILDTWQTKVLLQSVNNKNMKLKSINQSIISQVDSTLSGHNLENQLLRSRTIPDNIKRIIGHMEEKQNQDDDQEDQRNKKTIARTTYHPEIYNDEDFYASILNDRIQSRGQILTDTTDPIMMSQQFLRLRQLRRRKKKKDHVDQRASKGRKLRYQPHEKLINFMTPLITKYPKNDSLMTQLLYKSLFGSVSKSTK